MMIYEDERRNIRIIANEIRIGEAVSFGSNISIELFGDFEVGDFSRIGDNAHFRGNNVQIGKHFYNNNGLRIGGGGRLHPEANFICGDRCIILNCFLNVGEPICVGDDSSMSEDVTVLTHGFSLSVLEGFPASFLPVNIGSRVDIGYRSLIMMGVSICEKCIIGSQSIVTKSIERSGVYAGTPTRFIRDINPLTLDQRVLKIQDIIKSYVKIADYHAVKAHIIIDYPWISCNDFKCNVETFQYSGNEDDDSDDFRDYIRKWGIRIYTKRPFRSKLHMANL